MPSKSVQKRIRALQQKKFRKEFGMFVAEGVKLAEELLNSNIQVQELYATEAWLAENEALAGLEQVPVVAAVTMATLEQLSSLSTANEVLLVCTMPRPDFAAATLAQGLAIGLENVRDPGNMGTIIRLADWFGISSIVATPASVDVWNPKMVQATMGSITRVKVYYEQLDVVIDQLRAIDPAYPVMATVLGGSNIYTSELPPRGLVLFGNESAGLSEYLEAMASMRLGIPGVGTAESLNVGIACGVVCSELFRRQF